MKSIEVEILRGKTPCTTWQKNICLKTFKRGGTIILFEGSIQRIYSNCEKFLKSYRREFSKLFVDELRYSFKR